MSRSSRKPLLRLVLLLAAARLGLVVFGFRRTTLILRRLAGKRPCTDTALLVNWASGWTRRLRPLGTCLSGSLALSTLLEGAGVPCEVRLGVRRHRGSFQAHAWVELDGRPLNGGRRVRAKFATFSRDILAGT